MRLAVGRTIPTLAESPVQPAAVGFRSSSPSLACAEAFGHRFERLAVGTEALSAKRPAAWIAPPRTEPPGAMAPIQRARKRKKYGVSLTTAKGNKNLIESVDIQGRPAFSGSTKKEVARRYAGQHKDKKRGVLKPGYSRNHIAAWALMRADFGQHLQGTEKSKVNETIKNYFKDKKIPYKAPKKGDQASRIKHAGRALFNNVENLRVGDSTENSSIGSQMNSRLNRFASDYKAAANDDEKASFWEGGKADTKTYGIDSSPSGKRDIEQFASPIVKASMNARLGRPGASTPASAKKKKKPALAKK